MATAHKDTNVLQNICAALPRRVLAAGSNRPIRDPFTAQFTPMPRGKIAYLAASFRHIDARARGEIPIVAAPPPFPTRDFLPWRFSAAGRRSARRDRHTDQREVHRQIFDGDEAIEYAFMGQDPDAADNRWLHEAFENQIPIIYFLGIAPGALPGHTFDLQNQLDFGAETARESRGPTSGVFRIALDRRPGGFEHRRVGSPRN
jgi:hypothetical protein